MATVIDGKFSLNADLVKAVGLDPFGRVQTAIDNAVISYSIPYVPWETGTLAKSPYRASVPGSGRIVYPGPYARYQYYGNVYGPNIPVFEDDSGVPTRWFSPPGQKKHPTGKLLKYKTDTNPLAGSYWFERMKAAHMKDIVEEALKVAKNK